MKCFLSWYIKNYRYFVDLLSTFVFFLFAKFVFYSESLSEKSLINFKFSFNWVLNDLGFLFVIVSSILMYEIYYFRQCKKYTEKRKNKFLNF